MKKSCPKPQSPKFGFTIIELLVAMSIIGIIFGIGVAKYQEFNRRQILVQAAQELKSNLRFAQDKALAGEKPTACTDTLAGHRLEFIDNQNYKIVAVCGEKIDVKTGLSLGENVTKTGPGWVLFRVLAQGVENAGTFTLSSDTDEVYVTVTETGEIKYED